MKTAFFLLLLSAPPAFAVTRTWDSGGSNANFSTAANWNPDGVPANGDDLVFPAAAPNTVTNDLTGRTFGSLSFPAGTTIAGNSFTLTNGIATSAGGGLRTSVTIEPAVTLGANQTFTCNGAGGLTFEGSVNFGARTLTVTGANSCFFNGLTGSGTAGSRLIKNGTGLLRVGATAIATTTQPWDVSDGTLDVDGNLQAGVNLTGGKLTGDGTVGGALNASAGDIEPDAGDLSIAGIVTLGGTSQCLFHLTGPGAQNRLECSGGSVTIQGSATLTVDAVGYTPVWDEDFQILSKSAAGAITGTFSNAADNAEVPVGTDTVARAHYNGGNGNDLTLDIFSTTRTWDGGNTVNDNWDEAENWTLNTRPNFGDVLVFPPGIQSSDLGLDNNFPIDTTFRRLVFSGEDFTLRGNRLRLSHGLEVDGTRANIDTDIVLALDQTFLIRGGELKLDTLDKIDTAGHTLTLMAEPGIGNLPRGKILGKISGSGGVLIPSGSNTLLQGRNDYDGPTTVEPGGRLTILKSALGGAKFDEGKLGSPANSTTVGGTLTIDNAATGGVSTYSMDEPFVLQPGGRIFLDGGTGLVRDRFIVLTGAVQLAGPGSMTIDWRAMSTLSGVISGSADLQMGGSVEGVMELTGGQANSFTGSLSLTGGSLILNKDGPGVVAASGSRLEIVENSNGDPGLVETRQDEQIADNCEVVIGKGGTLALGNITDRTETIGSLDMRDGSTIGGTLNSRLKIKGNISASGNGLSLDQHPSLTTATEIQGTPCLLTVADGGKFHTLIGGSLTRSGNASIRRLGAGKVLFFEPISVPCELQAGETCFCGVGVGSPVTLNGGLVGGFGSVGSITSLAGGGVVRPGDTDHPSVLTSGSVAWNAATKFRMQIINAAAGGAGGHDRLVALGSVSLGNAVLQLTELEGFNVPPGTQISPLLNDGTDAIIGTFAGLPEGALIPISAANGGGTFRISYQGGDGNDVVLTRVANIPSQPKLTGITFSRGTGAGGTDQVTLAGTANPSQSLTLEASTNLQTWSTVQTVTANGSGAIAVTISQAPAIPKRFFRLK